jgi:hypothetical protein
MKLLELAKMISTYAATVHQICVFTVLLVRKTSVWPDSGSQKRVRDSWYGCKNASD